MADRVISAPAVLDTPPAVDEWGMVARIAGPIPGISGATTADMANVPVSVVPVVLLPANVNRKGALIYNNSSQALYVGVGIEVVSATLFTAKLYKDDAYELPNPVFTGAINGVWAGADPAGFAAVTETT